MTHSTGLVRRAALRGTIGALLVVLLGTLAGVAHAVPVGATAPPTGVLEIVTVPAVPGARFAIDGRTHRANRQGVVRVKVSSKDRHKVATVDNKISQQDRTLEFVRWYHGNHQKDYLRHDSVLMRELADDKPRDLVDSTVAARLNGYVARRGSIGQLRDEIASFGISPQATE